MPARWLSRIVVRAAVAGPPRAHCTFARSCRVGWLSRKPCRSGCQAYLWKVQVCQKAAGEGLCVGLRQLQLQPDGQIYSGAHQVSSCRHTCGTSLSQTCLCLAGRAQVHKAAVIAETECRDLAAAAASPAAAGGLQQVLPAQTDMHEAEEQDLPFGRSSCRWIASTSAWLACASMSR